MLLDADYLVSVAELIDISKILYLQGWQYTSDSTSDDGSDCQYMLKKN